MRDQYARTGKQAKNQESSKSSFSRRDSGSLLLASLIKDKGNKKHKRKSNSHPKVTTSNLSKKKPAVPSSNAIRNDSKRRKIGCGHILLQAVENKSSRKLVFPELHGRESYRNNANEEGSIRKLKTRRNKRKKKSKAELDEPSRLQRRTRYLMIRMKLEQNLIDAYSAEGWKGQSREKIRPEKELLRAKKQILKCKLGLREAIHQLDSLSTVGCIEDSVIAPDGSVSHEHIFCAKCKSNEVFLDNDIILCDGTCNCAFHQKCLDPPLDTESIPPGDQGWFCKFCESRMEIIEAMNAHLGTHFSVNSNWQDIFKDEASCPDGGTINPEEEWPSDDSEDDDYDPERKENSMSGAGTDDDASDNSGSSTSLGWSSAGEVSSSSRRQEMESLDYGNPSIYSSLDSDETSDGEIICGRRRRRVVDYKKLYDEMFGKEALVHEQVSEDEDWGPGKRKRREKESDAASTLMTLYESEKACKEVEKNLPLDLQTRRPSFRIPPKAVEKLRQAFAENELPSRSVKESLSKELGLDPGKVSKWFKNARYLALKSRKVDESKEVHFSSKLSAKSRFDTLKNKNLLKDSSAEANFCHPNNVKKVFQRKKPKSITSSVKINEEERETTDRNNEMSVDYSDDVSLKKLFKAKAKRLRNKVDSNSSETIQVAEAELERLCRAKIRLESMQQAVMRIKNGKGRKPNRTHILEESVIYVPVAELREKVL
ncbi:hypothetical protein K2173_017511 [Erythroxylum novogranatense]|uniref:Pathogenesis-related homeodomain protein n=1 Tax=Erythroxylum novogranatense TaxID=1862640 RepID=A0AAV8TKL0_9ROSI|nr:hypothetical protein K2173_017511 [Erythroxylum novogranatense]